MKIVTVIGARPQFIKAGALSREFMKHAQIEEIIVHTGQHYDSNMSAVFFEEMQIPNPKYHFDTNSMNHGAMTGKMLADIEEVLIFEKPDYLLVYGDTNSSLAGAIAASKMHIKVIHVEAGLRSFNMKMPEEINRILTDRISTILFCPTQTAVNNLMLEGFGHFGKQILHCGDVMQDAALFYKNKSDQLSDVLSTNQIKSNEFVLATIHRAENTDDESRLKAIVHSLNDINKTIQVIIPLHPRTAKILKDKNIDVKFTIISPVGYFDMLQLISHSRLILTDSGGLQKEAYFFNKYCITFRDETEWIELVDHGYNLVIGASTEKIIMAFHDSINKVFIKTEELYGGGKATENICKEIIRVDTI